MKHTTHLHQSSSFLLCRTMACFERNLHTQISSGDSVLSTTFCGITLWIIHFCFMNHYDIKIAKDVAKNVHCDTIMGLMKYPYTKNNSPTSPDKDTPLTGSCYTIWWSVNLSENWPFNVWIVNFINSHNY